MKVNTTDIPDTREIRASRRRSLSPLGLLCIGALVWNALMYVAVASFIGFESDGLMLLIPASILLIITAVVITGYRWTPLAATLGAFQVIALFFVPYISYHLTHPQPDFQFFVAITFMLGCWVIEGGAGISATVQNYQAHERRAPHWLTTALAGLGGIVLGAMLFAAILPAPVTATTTTNGNAVVHMGPGSFLQSSVTVQKGRQLQLIDDGAFLHVLSNGSYQNGLATPAQELGAPTISSQSVSGGSIQIGPFNTAGTFHIYCSVHPDMELTILVQ